MVYGPVDHDLSRSFLQEVRGVVNNALIPTVIGGDFNLILEVNHKSSKQVNMGLMEEFNNCIADLELLEIKRAGSRFTWTNKQNNPIFSNIDRIFVTTDWECKYPMCYAQTLLRIASDHSPIILDSGENSQQRPRQFFFEQQWLTQEGFKEGVSNRWNTIKSRKPDGAYSIDV